MGAGSSRRHETIRLEPSRVYATYRGQLDAIADDYEDIDLELPDVRRYAGESTTLTMPHVTGLREELQPGTRGAVPVLFDAPDGSHVEGVAQVEERPWPWRRSRYAVRDGAFSCSCGQDDCAHISQARDAVAAALNARRIRTAMGEWERRRGHVRETLAADHAASVAAPRQRPDPDGPSWAANPSHFQAAYGQARQRVAAGENPVPYMHTNATGGLGARDGGRAFGVEIEFDFPSTMTAAQRRQALEQIGRDLHAEGLTSSPAQLGYHSGSRTGYRSWTFESDASVAGEIVSPTMYDEPATWDQLERVCGIVRRHGGIASRRAGAHVSVSIADYDHTVANHESLVRGIREYEDVMYRLGQNTERRRHRRSSYSAAQPAPPSQGYRSIDEARNRNTRCYTVNLAHAQGRSTDRVEYRLWDATLDPAAIQSHINLSLGMTEAAFLDHSWGDATPIGTHYRHNREHLQGQRGARLRGDAWTANTSQVRRLVDRLFWRRANREQIAALFAATRWERP